MDFSNITFEVRKTTNKPIAYRISIQETTNIEASHCKTIAYCTRLMFCVFVRWLWYLNPTLAFQNNCHCTMELPFTNEKLRMAFCAIIIVVVVVVIVESM